jgi:hypothetical protein
MEFCDRIRRITGPSGCAHETWQTGCLLCRLAGTGGATEMLPFYSLTF